MEARHIPWDAYMQAMPSSGYLPDSWPATSPLYVSKHNPFILYNDVRSDPQWRDHIQPCQNMAADLNGPNPPRYVWISPDLCNDMHGGVTAKIKGFPETPCPYSNVAGDQNDELPLTIEEGFGLSELGYTSDASQVHPLWRLILSHH